MTNPRAEPQLRSGMSRDAPRRIGYVVKRYPRYSETFIVAEIAAHEAAGLEVEIFSLRPPKDTHFQEAIARVRAPVHYLHTEGVKAASHLWAALQDAAAALPGFWSELEAARGEDALAVHHAAVLACAVRRTAIEHLHAHFAVTTATVARLASRFAKVPYTFTAHAKDIFHASVRPEALRRNLSEAAATITVSDYNRDYLVQTYGPAAARTHRVYNGIDLQQFAYVSPERRPPRIAAVGRLVEKKGFADLVEACALLRDRGLACRCEIVGTGPLELALRALIQRCGVEDRVQLLGLRPRSEVVAHIRDAAVFAAPCVIGSDGDRDGLPTVLLEAMALGTPCVSTDVTGIPELLQRDASGLVVPQHDPAALAAALERLLTDPALRVRLATCARHRVEAEFDIRRTAGQLRAVFREARSTAAELARAAG
jgi:colanic acid/amylovoran biosynthesis glycosyltransferase